jgi:hypothetical protein
MPLSVNFPEPPRVPKGLPLLAVQAPRWSVEDVVELARRQGLVGKVADRGLWQVVDDGRSVLEVYQASQSFRFSLRTGGNELQGASEEPVDVDRVRESADSWVQRFAPEAARWELDTVAEQEVLISEREGAEPRRLVSGARANYRFTLDDLALVGPGAKMQVAVNQKGEIFEAYTFWRDSRRVEELPTIAPDQAFARFARSELFADLDDDSARAVVNDVRVGLLCLPPTEPQRFLIPVYELRGVLSTELHPHYEFVSYVAAAQFDDSTAKNSRWTRLRPRLVTA